jgi:hypothetical protein
VLADVPFDVWETGPAEALFGLRDGLAS